MTKRYPSQFGFELVAGCGFWALILLVAGAWFYVASTSKTFEEAQEEMHADRDQWMSVCRAPAAACARSWDDSLPPLSPFRRAAE